MAGRGRGRRACGPPTSSAPALERQRLPSASSWVTDYSPSPLNVRPGVHPVVVVHTVGITVAAIGERRLPVVHLLPERRIGRVVLVAELRVLRQAGSLRRRRQRGPIA